ncbi:tyrosine-type recombinase/integrase [Novosphingobium resinovorum]|jgi:integrase|nr:site-specific integrase [Novosphingobium resinovorum]
MHPVTKSLPKQPKNEGRFAAMPYNNVPAFVASLRTRKSFSRMALEFAILCASRSGEVGGARWEEFDLENCLWTVPKKRMKANREHVIPLTPSAIRIIERAAALKLGDCPLVFPGAKRNTPLFDMTLTKLLREIKEPYTAHGFRSAFRDWVSEETEHHGEVAEAALAHVAKDKTEAAYRRGNLLEKRRLLMNGWSAFCEPR